MSMAPPRIPNYEYRADIGGGGFAMVYRYFQPGLKRDVAVKTPKSAELFEDLRKQFVAEGESMAELGSHENVVAVYDTGTAADGRPYLIMEYCPGGDLAGGTPLPVEKVLDIGVQIAGAVQTAHDLGIQHRDIKPANVLVNKHGKPCLTDFGIAGRSTEEGGSGQLALSPPWSAPELLLGTARHGVPTEVFSLGATLWHLIAGHSPFMSPGAGHSLEAVERLIVSGWRPPSLSAPEDLKRLLLAAMAHEPRERPCSALELANGLRRIQKAQRFGETRYVRMPAASPQKTPEPSFVVPPPPVAPMTQRRAVPPTLNTAPRPSRNAPETLLRKGSALPVTIHRELPPVPEPPPQPELPVRVRWPHYVVGAVAAAAIVGVGAFLLSGQEKPSGGPSATTIAGDAPEQNAGADNAPPGRPVITATRLDEKTVRFAWNYSAQQATDTFSWRTSDGARTGVQEKAEVDVEGAKPLCLQVKVVRADGGNATAEWSQESCA
ncbi:serine/threonine-protein kinase [Lentzea californiensis]|uniref:serine/threonine-protein kinase n=1 Tax=Lentzea californiensis TaxID=438851 RepID=UPI00216503F8|nr:serine/threonine-protein kinase [Lentzea californiensis]MCR3753753.1 Serine/threonine protein kinase [Lentzea californiensis]